jgi:hypothetical protein
VRFKLDENIGSGTVGLFRRADHDVLTVLEQGMGGASDRNLFEMCRRERRCLVTLDLDFSDVTRFPPDAGNGIAIFRPPHPLTRSVLDGMVRRFLAEVQTNKLEGELWIIEVGRIRIHQRETSAKT